MMKTVGAILLSLVVCLGCSSILPVQDSYGPGLDSRELSNALSSVLRPNEKALSVLAMWYPETYGYENMDFSALDRPAGVLVVTETDVIFFGWDYMEYAPLKTIPRPDLMVVVAEARGKSRRLVLVSENDVNTFELVREDRAYVDAEGTEVIAALLSNDPDEQ